MTEKSKMPSEEIARKIAEQQRHAKETSECRRKLIRFDWATLPRKPLIPEGEHPKDFPGLRLRMADGREISMQRMDQSYIYGGHLLGAMHHPEKTVLETIERTETLFPWVEAPPAVLPPLLLKFDCPRTPIMRLPEQADLGNVTLPRVAVIAEFQSYETKNSHGESFSSLLVIWFQDRFGDPSAEVLGQIVSLDWDALAWNWAY